MTSHEYADRMIALAEFLKNRPEFKIPIRDPYAHFDYFSDKQNFLDAVRAVGAGRKAFKKYGKDIEDIQFHPATPKGTEIVISASRSTVCRKVQEEKWECDPLLSPEEEKLLETA